MTLILETSATHKTCQASSTDSLNARVSVWQVMKRYISCCELIFPLTKKKVCNKCHTYRQLSKEQLDPYDLLM